MNFCYIQGAQYVQALLKAYRTLMISCILHTSQIWFLGPIEQLEKLQLTFFLKMLTLTPCIAFHCCEAQTGPSKNFHSCLEDNSQFQGPNVRLWISSNWLAAHECSWLKWNEAVDTKINQLGWQKSKNLTERKWASLTEKLLKHDWDTL